MINKAQIMKRAWEIKKEHKDNIFGLCLKMAWAEAKEAKVEKTQREKDEEQGLYIASGYCGKAVVNESRWAKYGKDRTYVEVKIYTNGGMLKRVIKVGYQDNLTGKWFTDKDLY